MTEDDLHDIASWAEHGLALLGKVDAVALVDAAHVPDTTLVDLLRQLTGPQGLGSAVSLVARDMEYALGERHGRAAVRDEDGTPIAQVERQAGSTKWDIDGLWPVLAAAARDERAIDPDTGEALEDEFATAFRVLREVAYVSYARVEGLRKRGIDPDDYRTRTNWRWSVKLP